MGPPNQTSNGSPSVLSEDTELRMNMLDVEGDVDASPGLTTIIPETGIANDTSNVETSQTSEIVQEFEESPNGIPLPKSLSCQTGLPSTNFSCANCNCSPENCNRYKRFSELLPMQYFSTVTGDYKDVDIAEALNEVFKIRWTCPSFDDVLETCDLGLCEECSDMFVQLYRFYSEFSAKTIKSKSLLSTVITFNKDLDPINYCPSTTDEVLTQGIDDVLNEFTGNLHPEVLDLTDSNFEVEDSSFQVEEDDDDIDYATRIKTRKVRKQLDEAKRKFNSLTSVRCARKTIDTTTLPQKFHCDDCNRDFQHSIHLRMHILNSPVHKAKKSSDSESKKGPRPNKQLTVISDSDPKETRSSPRKTTKPKKHQCPLCPKQFTKVKEMKRHVKTHESGRKWEKLEKKITCTRCDKSFDTQGGYKVHFAAHVRDDNKHACSQCGKKFRKIEKLQLHERTDHGGFKPYECTKCSKRFRLREKLKLHVLSVHENKKPFKCEKCEKAFRTKYHLKIHDVAAHVQGGDNTLGCSQCKRKFADRESLDKHVQIHQEEKPYICSTCSKGFQTSARLKLHEKSHQQVPSCLCPICGKAYKHIRDLKLHEVIHQDESTYRFGCGDCTKKFYRIDLLRVHQSNEKHFSADVIGPSPAVRDKALGGKDPSFTFEASYNYLPREHPDSDYESESKPSKAKKRKTPIKKVKEPTNVLTQSIIPIEGTGNLQPQNYVSVIYHPVQIEELAASGRVAALASGREPSATFTFDTRSLERTQNSIQSHATTSLNSDSLSSHQNQFSASAYNLRELSTDGRAGSISGSDAPVFDINTFMQTLN